MDFSYNETKWILQTMFHSTVADIGSFSMLCKEACCLKVYVEYTREIIH